MLCLCLSAAGCASTTTTTTQAGAPQTSTPQASTLRLSISGASEIKLSDATGRYTTATVSGIPDCTYRNAPPTGALGASRSVTTFELRNPQSRQYQLTLTVADEQVEIECDGSTPGGDIRKHVSSQGRVGSAAAWQINWDASDPKRKPSFRIENLR